MIVVKIELWPAGDESQVVELHRIQIYNNLTNKRRPSWGNYNVRIDDKLVKQVDGHFRERGVIPLVRRALTGVDEAIAQSVFVEKRAS